MKGLLFTCITILLFAGAQAQPIFPLKDSTKLKQQIDSINRLLDAAVVRKDMPVLQNHYADDFVFTHGTGLIEGKTRWMKNVGDTGTHFLSRLHDSTAVELHDNIGIVTGTLTVKRQGREIISHYALRYVRVYRYQQRRWQLLSHRTTHEWHL